MSNKRTIAETIEFVEKSFPSVWTRVDVLIILNEIENMNGISESTINDIAHDIKEEVYSTIEGLDISDSIDKSSAEFELDGNKIELSSVDMDTSHLADEVTNNLKSEIIDIINRYIS